MNIEQKIHALIGLLPDHSVNTAIEIVKMIRNEMIIHPHLSLLCSDRVLIHHIRKIDCSRIFISGQETIHNRLVIKKKMTQCQRDKLYKARVDLKLKIIDTLGGKCQDCGYSKHKVCLVFHHIDPSTKDSEVGKMLSSAARNYLSKNYDKMKVLIEEVKKCKLLCPTCHAEVHLVH